jgi:glyoxylase-like metal-dependent hydrolase (beta-lactamase superfamily II)
MTALNIITIKLGIVNAYLLHQNDDFIMIDTGYSGNRKKLILALEEAGCKRGHLKLIVLTHADGDHIGNASYLREEYGSKIAMSKADSTMAETGDQTLSRKATPDHLSLLFTVVMKMGSSKNPNRSEGFVSDLYLEDGQSLKPFGFDATVIALPGHSKGSIGILTSEGDLFCGDLIYNLPGFGYIDDKVEHTQSINRVKHLHPRLIYPGHGKAFTLKEKLKVNKNH